MKEGLTLGELAKELVKQNEVKQDYLVDSSRMVMETCGAAPVLRVLNDFGEDCMEPLELTFTAHKQLGAYLRIPSNYYERMLKEAPELLVANVNHWLDRTAEVKLLRTMDGAARALLSNRYWCADNLELLQLIVPVLGGSSELTVQSCGLTETRMYIKVTSERLREDVVPGDPVQYGVVITNSEVGLGAITVQPLIFRLVCTNGMVIGEHLGNGTRRIHKGSLKTLDGPLRIYNPPSLHDQAEFVERLRKTLEEALTGTGFSEILEQMRRATRMPIVSHDLTGLIRSAGLAFGLRECELSDVQMYLLASGDRTLYGLANAVTRYAQDVASYDRATQLEAAGYDLMTMSERQWSHFNQYAAPLAAA